ncbi:MAG: lanthionine synthetase C family protein [Spirosomataceae bacterium]
MQPVSRELPQHLLHRIYRHVAKQPVDTNVSLFGGQMGYALFEAYCHRHFGIEDDSRVWERISASLNEIQEGKLIHSFAGGIIGIAWGFLHLFNQGLLQDDQLDPQSIVEDLDEGLFESTMLLLEDGNYDYLHGGLGACLYFLERTPSPQITGYLARIADRLGETAVRFPNGDITWKFDNFGSRSPQEPNLYNLGLSHGTASIVVILSLMYEKNYARERCRELIYGNLQWMWDVRNKAGNSIFPNTVGDTLMDQESRLAWCYGDLGIAHAFRLAGEKLQNEGWIKKAEQVMLHAAARRGPDTLMKDAPLCHGTMGASYLFRQFAKHSPEPELLEAADFWFGQTTVLARPETAEDVFLSYYRDKYESSLSLLDGEISIGMALLAQLGADTAWDRALLLS